MVVIFLLLVLFNCLVGVLAFLAIQRLAKHMRENPEASKLVAEHVIAPLLRGFMAGKSEELKPAEEEEKRTEGTIV